MRARAPPDALSLTGGRRTRFAYRGARNVDEEMYRYEQEERREGRCREAAGPDA
jgi:hypothetical protein